MYFLLLLLCLHYCSGRILFIKSNDSSSEACPGWPCATLKEYIQEGIMNYSTNSTFVFLHGYHNLLSAIQLWNIVNVTWTGRASSSSTTIVCHESIFASNATNFVLKNLTFFISFSKQVDYSVFIFTNSSNIAFYDTVFVSKGAPGRALLASSSSLRIFNSYFDSNIGNNGGAIAALQGTRLIISGSEMVNNSARYSGGAIYAINSKVTLTGEKHNWLAFNKAHQGCGGALYCNNCHLVVGSGSHFYRNKIELDDRIELLQDKGKGGAINVIHGYINIERDVIFLNNEAINGGGLSLTNASVWLSKLNVTFTRNTALMKGGGIYSVNSYIKSAGKLKMTSNRAKGFLKDMIVCGAVCLHNAQSGKRDKIENRLVLTLLHNSGALGGAIFATGGLIFTFISTYAANNSDGVIGAYFSNFQTKGTNLFFNNKGQGCVQLNNADAKFTFRNTFENNTGRSGAVESNSSRVYFQDEVVIFNNYGTSTGGGATFRDSVVTFQTDVTTVCDNKSQRSAGAFDVAQSEMIIYGKTKFCNNRGLSGGAINVVSKNLKIGSKTTFVNNSAILTGGAIHAAGTNLTLQHDSITFASNHARLGGALYLELGAILNVDAGMEIIFENNIAENYGGAIYHEDSFNIIQCMNMNDIYANNLQYSVLPDAFLQLNNFCDDPYYCPLITTCNDTAGKDGSFLFGGLLDRSRLAFDEKKYNPYSFFTSVCPIQRYPQWEENNYISSKPFRLEFCSNKNNEKNKTSSVSILVYRGQKFYLSLLAFSQGNTTVPTIITAETEVSAQLKLAENSQFIDRNCSQLEFHLYSSKTDQETVENLTLYTDGPCKSLGESKLVSSIHLMPCPHGFQQSRDRCVCDERLSFYNVSCYIDDNVSIVRHSGSEFWMSGAYNQTGAYNGLILCPTCPISYCTRDEVSLSLNDPDAQCNPYRSGALCGSCVKNYSIMLGGLQCGKCSNIYLLLLMVFAFAGVILTVFLTALRLTVSSGALNSFILYANLIQVNKHIFLASSKTNPLTLFLAWLNLDFGFTICLYDGLDSYVQTWLQYTFSLYVWLLMTLIIIASKYSLRVSKMVGSNPIAVLATLLLMSYNKILKITLDVFSSVNLEYPGGELDKRWMKDANISYFHSKHLYLSIVTILVLVLMFLPYTFLLLFGQCLYRVPQDNKFGWFLKVLKPLLDSYHAPYKIKTRYWTGFLLIIRCFLYTIFSFNSLRTTQYSLLAMIVVFSVLSGLSLLYRGIYKSPYTDAIEALLYLNLIIISAAAAVLPKNQTEIAAYVSVGFTFSVLFVVVVYQIYKTYVKESALYLKLKSILKNPSAKTRVLPEYAGNQEQHSLETIETDVREPLLSPS